MDREQLPFRIIGPEEVKELWPLVNLGDGLDTPKIIGALYHPDDGHIAPVDLTMALRKGARNGGAEIYEQTQVEGVERLPSGEWKVKTNKGEIVCEHVVCATGNYARETGRMFGINVPAIPVEHQFIVYDESPELKAYRASGGPETAVLRESDESYYLREERGGCLLCEYLKLERAARQRVVEENDSFLVVVPFWAVWPFETAVISKRHLPSIDRLSDAERDGMADILKRTTARYDRLFHVSFPYSMGIHQRPTDGLEHEEWHLHLHFYPPLLRSATVRKFLVGYEMLATPQRDITAEAAAERLRAV